MRASSSQRRRNIRTALLLLVLVLGIYGAFFVSMSLR
jgi:hypothetical protein